MWVSGYTLNVCVCVCVFFPSFFFFFFFFGLLLLGECFTLTLNFFYTNEKALHNFNLHLNDPSYTFRGMYMEIIHVHT
jgi:hypothetical protein